ncbi:MAG: AAA domain-containing protein [Nitrosospira sp.]
MPIAAKKKKTAPEEVLDDQIDGSTSLGKMVLGLMEEIKSKEKNSSKIILKDGVLSGRVGNLYIYDFFLSIELPFPEESALVITIGKRSGIRGYIHALRKNGVSVASEENVGELLNQVTITNSDSALLERLKDILSDLAIDPTSIPFSKRFASFVLAEEKPAVTSLHEIPHNVRICTINQPLNPQQTRAVLIGMGGEMLLLWGPPGTGKTNTIAPMLAAMAKDGESVLLVSNTNNAVNAAVGKVVTNLKNLDLTEPGTCLRIGQGSKPESLGKLVDLKTVAADKNKDLIAEREKLYQRRAPIAIELDRINADLGEYTALDFSRSELEENKKTATRLLGEERNVGEAVARLVAENTKLSNDLPKATTEASLFGRFGLTKTRTDIEKELRQKQSALILKQGELVPITNSLKIIREKIDLLFQAVTIGEAAVSKLPERKKLQTKAAEVGVLLSTIDERLVEIEQTLADTEQILIDNAKVIATTVLQTYLEPRLLKKQWDVVLIDEVSMLLLPMTYFAAGKAKKRVILVGDFQQLPSIISSDKDIVQKWLKADPFVKWGVDKQKNRKVNPPAPFVALVEQYRMHQQICDLVSVSFYKRELRTGEDVSKRTFPGSSLGETSKRILLIDSSSLGGWSSKRHGKGSLFNITHAALIGGVIDVLLGKGYFEKNNSEYRNSIGIVTPYAAQRELVAELLKPMKTLVPEEHIGTAHRFQGGEKDTMIIDFVESSFKPSRFINAETESDDAARLLNVALSRAREYLIVVVNKSAFDKFASSFMQRLLGRIESNSERIEPSSLLRDSRYFQKARELAIGREVAFNSKNVLFTEQDFYLAVTSDLSCSKKSVVIFSAFMTTNGVTRWLAVLNKALSQGTKIRIVTKTLDKQSVRAGSFGDEARSELSDLVRLMRRAGIVVDLRSETHEKIIVIDECVVWNGSLNMLSQVQSATTEYMTRTDDSGYAKEIISLLGRHDLRAGYSESSEHPTCPDCGSRTNLVIGFHGKSKLQCEDGCGWLVYQDSFRLLARGVPVGKRIKPCPESACNGSLRLRAAHGRYLLGCENFKTKSCDHKEEVNIRQFQYDPFPEEAKADSAALSEYSWPIWERPASDITKYNNGDYRCEVDNPKKSAVAVPKIPRKRESPVPVRVTNSNVVEAEKSKVAKPVNKRTSTRKKMDDIDFIKNLAGRLFGSK